MHRNFIAIGGFLFLFYPGAVGKTPKSVDLTLRVWCAWCDNASASFAGGSVRIANRDSYKNGSVLIKGVSAGTYTLTVSPYSHVSEEQNLPPASGHASVACESLKCCTLRLLPNVSEGGIALVSTDRRGGTAQIEVLTCPDEDIPKEEVFPQCQPPPDGPCSVSALRKNGGSCFGNNIETAAGVCLVESNNDLLAESGTDRCADGSSVSFGIFQINISANTMAGLNCPAAFDASYTGSHPTCNIIKRDLYNSCRSAAFDGRNNIAKACELSRGGTSWRHWGSRTRRLCGI